VYVMNTHQLGTGAIGETCSTRTEWDERRRSRG
jgi:hypothetical protein